MDSSLETCSDPEEVLLSLPALPLHTVTQDSVVLS